GTSSEPAPHGSTARSLAGAARTGNRSVARWRRVFREKAVNVSWRRCERRNARRGDAASPTIGSRWKTTPAKLHCLHDRHTVELPRDVPTTETRMHVPDGTLSPAVCVATGALSLGAVGYSLHKLKDSLGERTIPLTGMTAAVVFAAQMV